MRVRRLIYQKREKMSEVRQTILIVDDNPANIDVLNGILKDTYNITAATSGKQALKILEKRPEHDMILLDIMMPEMNGYEVCKAVKSNPITINIPIIFVTAMNEAEDEEKGLEFGAVDYITKPINTAITKARIKTHLALYEREQLLEQKVRKETAKRLEQQRMLLHQSRLSAMGEMMSAITHQWNQPLSIIGSATASLHVSVALDTLTNDELIEALGSIDNTVAFMSQTIKDFKNYLKPDKERAIFNVKGAVENVTSMLSSLLTSSNIEIKLNVDEGVTGFGVQSEFKQVVLNLISNAKDAINERSKHLKIAGKIRVVGKREGNESLIEVSDNGGGIPQDLIDQVFQDYFTTKEDKGTGIGLSMSKMIIEEEMHGSISVTNTVEGAKFILRVPAVTDKAKGKGEEDE